MRKNGFLFLFPLLFCVLFDAAAQRDSLLKELKRANSDTSRVNLMHALARECSSSSPDSARMFTNKAADLIEQLLSSEDFSILDFAKKAYGKNWHIRGRIAKKQTQYDKAVRIFRKSAEAYKKYKIFDMAVAQIVQAGRIHHLQGNYEKALEEFRKGLDLAREHEIKEKIGLAYLYIGITYRSRGEYKEAISYFKRNLELRRRMKDKEGIAASYNSLGTIMYYQGKYSKALDYFMKTLKVREEIGKEHEIAGSYNNIGAILMMQEHYKEALKYYKKYLNISLKLDNTEDIGKAYSNIGIIHQNLGNKEEAVKYYEKSAEILQQIGAKQSLATTLVNQGFIYTQMEAYEKARRKLTKCLEIARQIGDKGNKATALVNMGILNEQTGNYAKAIDFANRSLKLTEPMEALEEQKHAWDVLAKAYQAMGNYKKAFQAHKNFKTIADSIFSKEKHKQITELETKYQAEKKEKENQLLKKQNQLKSEQLRRQRTFTVAVVIVAILLIVLAVYVVLANIKQKQANQLLKDKNEEISQQKEQLNVQNEYIQKQHDLVTKQKNQLTDSINYASRIQKAMLPREASLDAALGKGNHFVFHKPREVVSGDFYWLFSTENRHFFVVADCTGHGIPGAFMSLIGMDMLYQIISQNPNIQANEILERMHKGVAHSLNQNVSSSRDGMDLGLLIVERGKLSLQFAGAKLPLFYINGGQHLLRGDRLPIGRMHSEKGHTYTNHKLQIKEPTVLYMYSDGFADQPGGMKQRKFMAGNFRKLLADISHKSLPQQKEVLEHTINKWMETTNQQVDDMLIAGIRFTPDKTG